MSRIEIVRGGYAITGHYVRDCWTVRERGKASVRFRHLTQAKTEAIARGASGKWVRIETRDGKAIKYVDAATVAET